MKNIVLIGMPGAGKSVLGERLAKLLDYSFVDTDFLISDDAGESLQSIIDRRGLSEFLSLEEQAGLKLKCDKTVIATGGSMVLSEKAMRALSQNAVVVYIRVPLDEIKRRITDMSTRGIAFGKGETLDDVYAFRKPLYEKYAELTFEFEESESAEKSTGRMAKLLSGSLI